MASENHQSDFYPNPTQPSPAVGHEQPHVDLPKLLIFVALGYVIAAAVFNTRVFQNIDSWNNSEDSLRWYAFMFGVLGGEAGLLAIAAVLGKGPAWLRMVVAFGTGLCWIGSAFALAPQSEASRFHPPQVLILSCLCFPLLFLTAQLPLWICRILLRWRIEPLGIFTKKRQPQLTIAGIFAFTTAVAIAVGLVNLAAVIYPDSNEKSPTLWESVGVMLLSAFIASALTTVPLALVALRPRNGWIGAGLTILWTLSLTGLIALTLIGQNDFWNRSMRAAITFSGAALSTTAPLFLLRRWNYGLRWGRE